MSLIRAAGKPAMGWRLLGGSVLIVALYCTLTGGWSLPAEPLALIVRVLFTSVCVLSAASLLAFGLTLIPALVFTRCGATPIHRDGLPSSDHLLHTGAMVWMALFVAVYTMLILSLPGLFEGLSTPYTQAFLAGMLARSIWGIAAITAPVALVLTLAQRHYQRRRLPQLQRALPSASETSDAT